MAKFFDALTDGLIRFIEKQHMFCVASAPADGRVNLSPKGMDTFRVLDASTVAYLDLTGSGNETSAHIHENGRVTIMMCSYDEEALILRIYGRGEVVYPGTPRWDELSPKFDLLPGARQIVVTHVESVQTSCGFAVPRYAFVEHRPTLVKWAAKKGDNGLVEYRAENNRTSIDSAPTGLELN
jgi:hypothetical protein